MFNKKLMNRMDDMEAALEILRRSSNHIMYVRLSDGKEVSLAELTAAILCHLNISPSKPTPSIKFTKTTTTG